MSTEKKKSTSGRPDLEITLKTERRRNSILRKLRILDHADACKDNKAELDELLQREDLSLFQLSNWRKQKAEGRLAAGIRKAKELEDIVAARASSVQKTAELEHRLAVEVPSEEECKRVMAEKDAAKRETAELERRLLMSELIIDVQHAIGQSYGFDIQDSGLDGH